MQKEIERILQQAGEIILSARLEQRQIREKSSAGDLVTQYDVAVEEFLRRELGKLCPEAEFLGEEEGGSHQADTLFIMDPIDGTTNFIRGYAHSNISVALTRNGRAQIGVVYDPFRRELFSARLGAGATLNGVPIRVSERDPAHGLFLLGSSPYRKELAEKTFANAATLFARMADFRRMAAAALDFCYVACGRAEVYFEYGLQPWDFAAGALIAREAGAVVHTMDGEELPFAQPGSAFVATPRCAELFLQM